MINKTDPALGQQIHEHLSTLGLETLISNLNPIQAMGFLFDGVEGFLQYMGLDITDPSLRDTPTRVAEMFANELCFGLNYNNFPKCTTTPNGTRVLTPGEERSPPFSKEDKIVGRVDEMVMVDSIQTISLCEHHFQTISGVTHVAYIPGTKLLGLSKFARVANFFARRPQVQERMTEQIYAALSHILETPDVAIQQVCTHHCMRSRGSMDPHSKTTTSKLGGRFKDNPSLRAEFLHGIR